MSELGGSMSELGGSMSEQNGRGRGSVSPAVPFRGPAMAAPEAIS